MTVTGPNLPDHMFSCSGSTAIAIYIYLLGQGTSTGMDVVEVWLCLSPPYHL